MDKLLSAVIYLSTFGLALFICAIFQKQIASIRVKNISISRIIAFLFIVTIIALPVSYISGIRDGSVGVDTAAYLRRYEEVMKYSTLNGFINARNGEDILFNSLLFCCAKYLHNESLYLGLLQYFSIVPLLIVGFRHSEDLPVWKILTVYYLWYYVDSLNAVRQYTAVAFTILMVDFCISNLYLPAIACLLIATGFHSGSWYIAIILFAIVLIIHSEVGRKFKIFLVSGLVGVLAFGQKFIAYLYDLGLFPVRWKLYMNTFIYQNSGGIEVWRNVTLGSYFEILARVIIVLLVAYKIKETTNKIELDNQKYYKFLFVIGLLIYIVGVVVYNTPYLVRISIYFDAFIVLILPCLDADSRIQVRCQNHSLSTFSLWYSLAYWIIHAYIMESGRAFPYLVR